MHRENFNDLIAFLAVARERSFTRAAAKLGISQSALSHIVRDFEARLGLRLLTRTTRSVAPTKAGEHLLQNIGPHFDEIEAKLAELGEFREKPVGSFRISTGEHAADTILLPKLKAFLQNYPDIVVEITIDYGLIDIVEKRYDLGIRLGERIQNDMIAVRIGPAMRMAVVGSPSYFIRYPLPETPQDLIKHSCINIRLPTYDTLYAWEFEKDGRELNVQVKGQLIFNQTTQRLKAALSGVGLAYLPEDMVLPHLADGSLVRVLDEWCAPFPGYYLYYPNRRQPLTAFTLLVDALRYQEPTAP